MSVQSIFDADRRLVILTLLLVDSDHRVNEHILRKEADRRGHDVEQAVIRADLKHLEKQLCVKIEILTDADLWIARLTETGRRVALGKKTVPGVAEPALD